MASSNELLSSKIVILEEEPSIPAITALPSAVCLNLGITERGPIADRTLLTSFEEYTRYFGGFTTNSDAAIAAHGFFYNGGSFMWVSRTCHFTDLTDRSTYTAAKGSVMLQNAGNAASAASVTGTETAPFNLPNGAHIDIDIGAGSVVSTFTGTAASMTDGATYPITVGAVSLGITVKGANNDEEQTVTPPGSITSVAQVVSMMNGVKGIKAIESFGHCIITSDIEGSDSEIQITADGGLNAILLFPTTLQSGGGNVARLVSVTQLEVEAVVEAAVAGLDVVNNPSLTMSFNTVATGIAASVQVVGTSTVTFGCDAAVHNGADATPENTLLFDGKTPGAYTDNLQVVTTAASSGVAGEFNVQILINGTVREVFPNCTMGDGVTPDLTMTNYVVTVINHLTLGSDLVQVTDQLLAYTAVNKRPANGTSAAMTGGDDGLSGMIDSDIIGNEAGPTGLFCFDQVSSGRILIVPGQVAPAVLLAMVDYVENHRLGSMFCILDCPAQYTAAQMVSWMGSAGLSQVTEYAAIYWPRIKVTNPSSTVYGNVDAIYVPTSGYIAGKYASNDKNPGGVYEQPAGIGSGYGIIRGMIGLEPDPSGGSEHEVLDERKRDLIAPQRINPILRLEGTTWHIDGHDTLKSTGNFPSIGERRGVIFIEQSIKAGLIILKHRFNNEANRRLANRIITAFLLQEMRNDAFRSRVPAEAFYVDTSEQLNPVSEVFAGRMNIRIGLATNKPAKFIIVSVTQDTRALQEELAA